MHDGWVTMQYDFYFLTKTTLYLLATTSLRSVRSPFGCTWGGGGSWGGLIKPVNFVAGLEANNL